MMDCPRCESTPVEASYLGPVLAYRCGVCDGHWFARGELITCLRSPAVGYLVQRWLDAPAPVVKITGAPRCPVCDLELRRQRPVELGKAAVDVCGRCGGTWLDGHEIRLAFHARTRGRPPWSQWWDALEQVVGFWRRS